MCVCVCGKILQVGQPGGQGWIKWLWLSVFIRHPQLHTIPVVTQTNWRVMRPQCLPHPLILPPRFPIQGLVWVLMFPQVRRECDSDCTSRFHSTSRCLVTVVFSYDAFGCHLIRALFSIQCQICPPRPTLKKWNAHLWPIWTLIRIGSLFVSLPPSFPCHFLLQEAYFRPHSAKSSHPSRQWQHEILLKTSSIMNRFLLTRNCTSFSLRPQFCAMSYRTSWIDSIIVWPICLLPCSIYTTHYIYYIYTIQYICPYVNGIMYQPLSVQLTTNTSIYCYVQRSINCLYLVHRDHS